MNLPYSIWRPVFALSLTCALPAAAHATAVYDEIAFKNASGTVLASVTATAAQLADPDSVLYLTGVAVDSLQYGNYSILVDDDGDALELFGISNQAPDGEDLSFALQGIASAYFPQNPVLDTGAPIDMTMYLDPGLQALGDTATFLVSGTNVLPEPMTWAMMVTGFAAVGLGLRRQASGPRAVSYAGGHLL